MRRIQAGWLVAALLLGVGVAPASAQDTEPSAPIENAFTRGELTFDETAMHVALEARSDVGEPRVRTESGFVRVWFPEMTGWMNVDLAGDGGAVRFARVRPGADDSGVLVIRVGDGRRVPEGAVAVARAGARTVISIARASLPPVIEPPSLMPPIATPMPPATAAAAPVADAVPTPAPAAEAAEPSAVGPRTAAEALASSDPEGAAAAEPATLGIPSRGGWSSFAVLFGITLMLAAALGLVHWFRTRAPGAAHAPSIRIVAAARLSPRQQLVVVRALGQDHLIALEPGRTERLLSIPTSDARPEEEPVPELRLSRPVAEATPAAGSFGAELLRLVENKASRAPTVAVPAAASGASSEAVAGLVRLRAAASR